MIRTALFLSLTLAATAQVVRNYEPVTQQMLENPSPNDWLMYNRTYDSQRYSPLKQIDRTNVNQLRMVWTRGQSAGAPLFQFLDTRFDRGLIDTHNLVMRVHLDIQSFADCHYQVLFV